MKTVTACLCVALMSGCLIRSSPARGVRATGEPLKLTLRSNLGDGSMQPPPTVDSSYGGASLEFAQGEKRIDEEDFYRLAGDHASQERVHARRKSLVKMQKIGLFSILGGVGVLGGGVGGGLAADSTALIVVGAITGILAISFGSALYGSGRSNMDDTVIPADTAREDADLVQLCVPGFCTDTRPGGARFRGERDSSDMSPLTPAHPWRRRAVTNIAERRLFAPRETP